MNGQPDISGQVSAPGETLAELMAEHDMTLRRLSERIDVSICYLEDVINGQERISLKLATGLQTVFGVSSEFWITRDELYWQALHSEFSDKGVDMKVSSYCRP